MSIREAYPNLDNGGESQFANLSAGPLFDGHPQDSPVTGRTVHELLSMQPYKPGIETAAGTVYTTGTGVTEGPSDHDSASD